MALYFLLLAQNRRAFELRLRPRCLLVEVSAQSWHTCAMQKIILPLTLVALVLVGCNKDQEKEKEKEKDECQVFVDRSSPTLRRLAIDSGKAMNEGNLKQLVEMCRTAEKRDPVMDCVLGVTDEQAIRDCWEQGFRTYADGVENPPSP